MTEPHTEGWQDYVPHVSEYLADCGRARAELEARGSTLDRKNHPTPDGAVKLIAHGGDPAEAEKIRLAFGELTGPAPGPGGAARTPSGDLWHAEAAGGAR